MKRFMSVFVIALLSVALLACGKKEFAQDGTFRAFELGDNYGTPMITWADVVVKDGKVESITLDALQATVTEGSFAWNAKSKKELGYAYRMHQQYDLSEEDYIKYLKDNNKLEWFEQANLIEKAYKDNKNASLDGLTNVTITTSSYKAVVEGAFAFIK